MIGGRFGGVTMMMMGGRLGSGDELGETGFFVPAAAGAMLVREIAITANTNTNKRKILFKFFIVLPLLINCPKTDLVFIYLTILMDIVISHTYRFYYHGCTDFDVE